MLSQLYFFRSTLIEKISTRSMGFSLTCGTAAISIFSAPNFKCTGLVTVALFFGSTKKTRGRFFAAGGVAAEQSGQGELAQLVTDHVLGDVDGHVAAAVMHGDGVADHLRKDGRIA